MKIAYVAPGVMEEAELARRAALLQAWAAPDTEIAFHAVSEGPRSIESAYEEYLSVIPAAQKMVELEAQGFDAAILGCACDPGVNAMRELTQRMLIVGAGAASYLTATMLGNRFAVLTIDRSMIQTCYSLSHAAGCSEKLVAVEPVEIPVLELAQDRAGTLDRLAEIGGRILQEKRADTLVLGCMSMGFLNVAEALTERLGVPCVNPCKAALQFAQALTGMGLLHSKAAFPLPTKLRKDATMTIGGLYVRR